MCLDKYTLLWGWFLLCDVCVTSCCKNVYCSAMFIFISCCEDTAVRCVVHPAERIFVLCEVYPALSVFTAVRHVRYTVQRIFTAMWCVSISCFKDIYCHTVCSIFCFENIYCCGICSISGFEDVNSYGMCSISRFKDILLLCPAYYILLHRYLLLCDV